MPNPKPDLPLATAEEVAALQKEQEKEYGTYVAVAPISFNGSPAYNVGDPVPVSNVERHGYVDQGVVARVGTKAAQDVASALHQTTTQQAVVETPTAVSLNVPVEN